MINQLDQKDAWFLQRYSKFTASVIYKLWDTDKSGKGFSVGGMTYINEKVVEEMTAMYERPELEFVESLLHGKMYEQPAFEEYVRVTKNNNMRYFGTENPLFLDFNKYSGGSPDGIMGEGTNVMWGLELKCPKEPKNHFLYLKFKSQWDLKEKRFAYYCQIQFLLMITKAEGWHWCSYDERFKDAKLRTKIIEVLPDKKFQDNLEIRIALAQKEKLKIINEFKNAA